MPPTSGAWRRLLRHRVTIQRNTTTTSASGATKFNYATVATGVRCSVQDRGGRMRQDDVGQIPARQKSLVCGAEVDLRQTDHVVLENFEVGKVFVVTHTHNSVGDHLEAVLEQVVTEGGD
jgi:hypothetical protein